MSFALPDPPSKMSTRNEKFPPPIPGTARPVAGSIATTTAFPVKYAAWSPDSASAPPCHEPDLMT